MSTTSTKTDVKYYIHVLIMLFFFFGFGHLSPIGTITEVGMQILGVFLGMIWGWMFIDMLWPSLLGLFALGLTDYAKNVTSILATSVSNKNVILVFFFLVLSQYLEHSGLSKTIAFKLLTLKAIEGKPWLICFMIFLITYLLGVFISIYAVIFLVWAIIYDMCQLAGYNKEEALPAFLLVGVAQISALGSTIMPYQTFSAVVLNALNSATGIAVPSISFIFFNLIVSFLALLAYFFACKFIIKIDVSRFKGLNREKILNGNQINYDTEQKIATVVVCLFLFLILVPSFLGDGNILYKFYKKIGDQGILVMLMCTVCALKIRGKHLAKMDSMINKGINWSLLFLLMATFTIGDAVNSDEAGIITQISTILTPIFSQMSAITFIILAFILLCIITQVAHNLVLAVVFVPLLSNLAISSGLGESVAIIVSLGLGIVLKQALMTPAASNRGAMIYGNDWVGRHYAFVFGTIACISAVSIVIIAGIPIGFLIF